MPASDYSRDVWDYLGDLPYMPSRADRDALVAAAEKEPDKEKRVRIWDYFFRINPDDVGRPQAKEIAELNCRRDKAQEERHRMLVDLQSEITERKRAIDRAYRVRREELEQAIAEAQLGWKERRWLRNLGLAFGIIGIVLAAKHQLGLVVLAIAGIMLIAGMRGMASIDDEVLQPLIRQQQEEADKREREIAAADAELQRRREIIEDDYQSTVARIDREIKSLEALIEELRAQIPAPPSDEEVHQWLQEDIRWLTREASERSGLSPRLVNLADGTPNPLCILGPAELQSSERIPEPFMKDPDRHKHLRARRFATLPDGTFDDFYGVYNVEFILIAEDMLGTYGCFYDFIMGRVTGERTSEQYYHDVVAISMQREYREVDIGGTTVPVEDAPTFSMSLSSGEIRQISFASASYFEGMRRQLGEQAMPHFDPQRWARNPEKAADNAIKALRARLRAHKGAPGEQ